MVNRILKLFILASIVLLSNSVNATHYMGGDVTYEYLDNNGPAGNPFRYKILFNIYINGSDPQSDYYCGTRSNGQQGQFADNGDIDFAIFDKLTGARIDNFDNVNNVTRYNCSISNTLTDISPDLPPGCIITSIDDLCLKLNSYETIVNLPFSLNGFTVIHERCCRNGSGPNGIDNLGNAGSQGTVLFTEIPPSINNNTSPQFTDNALPAICVGDTVTLINNAFDPDGDFLVYSFTDLTRPSIVNQGNPSPSICNENNYSLSTFKLPYAPGFSLASPFGAGGYAFINSSTGLTRYYIPNTGDYVIGIEVKEYRNIAGQSILLSTTVREIQLVARVCPVNNTPIISTIETGSNTSINIFAGDSIHLTIETTDIDLDEVNIEVTGAILEAGSGYLGPLATFVFDSVSGIGNFDWKTECGMAGSYQFVVGASDDGCPPKKNYNIYTVNILPFEASPILGSDTVCFSDDSSNFSTTPTIGSKYKWAVNNGVINKYNSDSTEISISWGIPGNGRIEMIETSEAGCSDTIFKIVLVNDAEIIKAEQDTVICYGDTIRLSAQGTSIYQWTPFNFVSDSSIANPLVYPDTTTEFIISSLSNKCYKPDTLLVVVNQVTLDMPSDTTCMRDSLKIGESSVKNYKYTWSPKFGLDDTTIAQPTLWLDTAGTFSYNISIIDSNSCKRYDTISVLINPAPDSVQIFGGTSLCPDITGIDYYVTDTTLISYTWLINGGLITSGQSTDSIVVDWGAANPSASVEIIPENNYGCKGDTSKLDVLINQILQTETPNGPDTLCFFDLVNNNYSITNINGSTYTWNVIGGNINTGQGTNATNLDWTGGTEAYVFIEEAVNTSSSVCLGKSDTLRITINTSPDTTLPIMGDSSLCSFTQNSNYWLNGMNNSTYSWLINTGGTIISGQNTNSIQVNWDSTGTYPITVIETTEYGCIGRIILDSVTINPLPQTTADVGTYIICPQNTENINYVVSGLSNSTYTWVYDNDTLPSTSNTSTVTFDTSKLANSLNPNVVYVTETSEYGCTNGFFFFNIEYDPSDINLTYVTDNFEDESLVELHWSKQFIDSLSNDIQLYRRQIKPSVKNWEFISTISKFENTYTDSPLNTATESYQYYLTTQNLCSNIDTTFLHNNILLEGVGDEASATTSISWNKYANWSQFDGVREYNIYRNLDDQGYELYETTSSIDSLIEFVNAGDGFSHCYRIEAVQTTNDNISSWSNEVCIDYNHLVHVYNALTPNGDGKNDFFYAENIWLYTDNQLEIYNRWGNLVNSTNGYNNDWNGENLPDGTYFYVLKVTSNEEETIYKGDVLIQR